MLRVWAIVLATLFAAPAPGFADDKPLHGVALVIGQSDYTGTLPKLTNPRNDAAAMSHLLGELGFSVTTATDDDDSPADWADSQEGLGWALANSGALQKDRDLVQQGRDAMQNAADYYHDQNGAQEYYDDKLAKIDKLLRATS